MGGERNGNRTVKGGEESREKRDGKEEKNIMGGGNCIARRQSGSITNKEGTRNACSPSLRQEQGLLLLWVPLADT